MRRGFDLACTLGPYVLQLPQSEGVVRNFQLGVDVAAVATHGGSETRYTHVSIDASH